MQVAWTRTALLHLEEIQDYVAQDSPAAAYDLAIALTQRPNLLLADNPMLGRIGRALGTRELVMGDLPYIIVYRVTRKVEILAVIHTARQWPDKFD
jgi:addiction module RelE/StbE family toxin